MFLFGSNHGTLEKAKKTREAARQDRLAEKPGAEKKLLTKIPTLKDRDRLFYCACMDHQMIRAAAIARIQDPWTLHQLVQVWAGEDETLRWCADNPAIAEADLVWIVRNGARDAELRKYIIRNRIPTEAALRELACLAPGTGTQLCALGRLKERDSLISAVTSGHDAVRRAAVQRLLQEWPSPDTERALLNAVDCFIGRDDWIAAAEVRDRVHLRDDKLDRRILDAIRARDLKDYNAVAQAAAMLVRAVESPELLTDFALSYSVSSSFGKGLHKDRDILKAALSKLPDERLLHVIRHADAPHTQNKMLAVEYLSRPALLEVALTDVYVGADAVKRLTSAADLRRVMDTAKCSVARENAFRALGSAEGGQPMLAELYEQWTGEGKRAESVVRQITDEGLLLDLLKRHPDDRKLADQLLSRTKSEAQIVHCLTAYPLCIASPSKLKKLSVDARRTIALSALDSQTRSFAAQTLQSVDPDRVTALHDCCRYCGGKIESTLLYAGTIEAHFYYRCTACGRDQHQTILGNDTPLMGDYYVYR